MFDDLHRTSKDPWDFATSPYEIAKRAATIAALPDRNFPAILEIGCSTGYLSQALAHKGDHVLALDISAVATGRASARIAAQPGAQAPISFRQADVPTAWPNGVFDLIVFSEVLYFMMPQAIARSAALARAALAPGGLCLLVNWTGENDLDISGDEAARLFMRAAPWTCLREERAERYVLQLLQPPA